jgi:hypothetical protein
MKDSLDSCQDSSPLLKGNKMTRIWSQFEWRKRCNESFLKVRFILYVVKTSPKSHFLGAPNLIMVHHRVQETIEGPSRIAFGSCNDQDHQNNLWPIIESRRPAAFVWGGDAIYAGT